MTGVAKIPRKIWIRKMIRRSMEQFISQLINEQLGQATAIENGIAELFECLVRIKELFSRECRDHQELLASQLVHHSQEGNLEEIYALSFNLFEGECDRNFDCIYYSVSQPLKVYHAKMI